MAAKYDLTHTMTPYLDRHMVFPLLGFLKTKKIFPEEDVFRSQIELSQGTNMVDFVMDLYKDSGKTVPEELQAKRTFVVNRMKELSTECAPLLSLIEKQPQVIKDLQAEKKYTMAQLTTQFGIQPKVLDSLYLYAKFVYDCGLYLQASEYLYHFRCLNTDPEKNFNALWGKYAAEILKLNWEGAAKDMNALKEAIDTKTFSSPLTLLQQRTWFIHWSLFVFFNHPHGRNLIITTLFQEERYLNTIQTSCPHILRYLTTAVIINKRRKNVLKELVKVIQQESYMYRDPITEFVEDLYVNFDFDGAQQKLRECSEVLQNDFFLARFHDDFIENARLFIFETYCRIHQCIDIGMLAEKLNMDQEAAERWIVNLIRNAQLDAKIDSAANHVIMSTQHPSIYQQVIEKTKGLTFRSHVLTTNIEKITSTGGKQQLQQQQQSA